MRRTWLVVLGGVVVLLAGCDGGGEGESGSGLTYRGEFYWLSDAEVRPAELGAVVATDVPMMDFDTDLRRVGDLDPDDVLAAEVPIRTGEGTRWQVVATDQDVGADPWSSDAVAELVLPARSG